MRFHRVRWVLCFGVMLVPLITNIAASQKTAPSSRVEVELSYAPLVKDVAPAVVSIFSRRIVNSIKSPFIDDPFFRYFFGDDLPPGWVDKRVKNSLGSGVIVSPHGYIVTNFHVIKDSGDITVGLADRRQYGAHVVLADERTDLAVLKLDIEGELHDYLELRNSDSLEVGDIVLAIGNPFGVGQTVTSGIVSAVARTQVKAGDYRFFIQTDAAINPGNSGGALVTLDGKLAGINTAIFSRTGGSIGIGFAIPANLVAVIIKSAIKGERFMRPWFGASGQLVNAEIADALGFDRPGGVLIEKIYPSGPADQAGLKIGDIVFAVDGRDVVDPAGMAYRVAIRDIGENITLNLTRDGRKMTLIVKLSRLPEDPLRDVTELKGAHPLDGATAANLSPALADELGVDSMVRGVILIRVPSASPAGRVGLRGGDIVLSVNNHKIITVADLELELGTIGEDWKLRLRRGNRVLNLRVRR